jgi:hypothetical protein
MHGSGNVKNWDNLTMFLLFLFGKIHRRTSHIGPEVE